MTIPGTELSTIELSTADAQARIEDRLAALEESHRALIDEISLLSGRLEITLRALGRLLAKIDPSFLDDPHDPAVRERSRLLGETVLNKLRDEAISTNAYDPEALDRLHRYFKGVP
jgi:hypothetical protein